MCRSGGTKSSGPATAPLQEDPVKPDRFHELQSLYPDGRRVRILPKSEGVRAKIPEGVTEGLVRGVVPMPAISEAPDQDAPPIERYGVVVEFELPSGKTDQIILDFDDVEVLPHGSP
ncbi:MAG: hypothetical protein QY323_00315 [Patescibacteria group bacterium]|nr:MAG: hypothetical protein QY323_00315 [Patescibacteria group bacterium]